MKSQVVPFSFKISYGVGGVGVGREGKHSDPLKGLLGTTPVASDSVDLE